MKRKTSVFLSLVALLSVNFLYAQDLDQIVTKHIEAMGGKDNWNKVNTLKLEASITVQGMDIPITIYQVHEKANKQEYTVMNSTGYTIIRSDSGWTFNPMMGQTAPEPITGEELKEGQEDLDIRGELLNYKAKGAKLELLGKDSVDGVECYKLKMTKKSGSELTFYLDTKTYYILQTVGSRYVNGQPTETTVKLGDYKKTPEGLVFPHTIENGVAPAPINIIKVEVNPVIADSVFKVNS